MSAQKKVLLVTNSATDKEISLIKQSLHTNNQQVPIKLSLVHVIPNLPTSYFNIPSMALLADNYYSEATKTLNKISEILNIDKKDQWVITGRIRTEVLRLAHQLGSHFILASSLNIQDLYKSFLFMKKEQHKTPIRSINSLLSF